jgi:hypothetical protein
MDDMGFLYILANSAMPGLVKIGKTIRSPSERAAELSAATGLPTPFIVVYEQLFRDCSAAEAFVHTHLAAQGYRVADNREFFNAPVNDVVRAIALAPDEIITGAQYQAKMVDDELLSRDNGDELDSMFLSDLSVPTVPPWHSLFEAAQNSYYGVGDCIQDSVEALRLYRQAAKLGCLQAYSKIGGIYELGEGVREDSAAALEYYKEGARKGSVYCYWCMAMLFTKSNNNENAKKCFSLFVKNLPDNIPDESSFTDDEYDFVGIALSSMLVGQIVHHVNIPDSLSNYIYQHRNQLIVRCNLMVALCQKNQTHPDIVGYYSRVILYLESLPG